MSYSILIVDDSEIIRGMLERTLRLVNLPIAQLYQAADGAEALAILQDDIVDLVLTDINMPNMDGIEMVQTLRRDPALAQVPVAVISTEGSDAMRDLFAEMGVKAFLRKPFTPEKIRDLLHRLLPGWEVTS